MRPRDFKGPIQPMRVEVLSRYIRYVEAVGAPVERLPARSGISAVLLDNPMALVRQESATRFIDLAGRCFETEHLGVQVRSASGSLRDAHWPRADFARAIGASGPSDRGWTTPSSDHLPQVMGAGEWLDPSVHDPASIKAVGSGVRVPGADPPR
jgi:hypothetical protein